MIKDFFTYSKWVQFHETDMMGVAHHSNYIKWMEEARLAWLMAHHLQAFHSPKKDYTLAVLESFCVHKNPCRMGDKVFLFTRIYAYKLRFTFNYGIYSQEEKDSKYFLCAYGHTVHIGVDQNMKVKKPDKELLEHTEPHPWTETWPLNL